MSDRHQYVVGGRVNSPEQPRRRRCRFTTPTDLGTQHPVTLSGGGALSNWQFHSNNAQNQRMCSRVRNLRHSRQPRPPRPRERRHWACAVRLASQLPLVAPLPPPGTPVAFIHPCGSAMNTEQALLHTYTELELPTQTMNERLNSHVVPCSRAGRKALFRKFLTTEHLDRN